MEERINKVHFVEVRNRNNGTTGYTLSNGVTRLFNLGETKKIDIEELREASTVPGGQYILENYLIINDKTALEYLDINPEPEYFYTEKEVKELLEKGSLDQLEDCLNFAPQGVIDLLKKIAVDIQLPDMKKRKMISDKTGFSIDNAIRVNEALEEEDTAQTDAPAQERKAEPITPEAPKRKYTVLSQDK